MFAGRVSAETLRANQLRLYFSALAYLLLEGLRRLGRKDREMARAQTGTIRLKLLKIGAQIRNCLLFRVPPLPFLPVNSKPGTVAYL